MPSLAAKKSVVTANKGPLVVAYRELVRMAKENDVRLLYEATVGAHVPVFCLVESCFKADELQCVSGILNATTNFVIGEMEKGRGFQEEHKPLGSLISALPGNPLSCVTPQR